MKLTQERIMGILDFSSCDGGLIWRCPRPGTKSGGKAGTLNGRGYWQTGIDGKVYLNHRIVFLLYYGYLPKYLDHIDGDKCNNNIKNLRPCSHFENCFNTKIRSNNTSGVKGVYWHKESKKWIARVQANGKESFLGRFNNIKLAELAVKNERYAIHGQFFNHGEK